jgi:HAD superfamily hydrolase (TIGR01509 family)
MAEILILDAMGVLYATGDDVAELLVPFVRKHGRPDMPEDDIDRAYTEASLGKMDATAFWNRMGVPPALEDDYLAGHRLIDGTRDALTALKKRFDGLACLSNDVSSWSRKLRQRFALETWIDTWFISGDMGLRKPSPEIYLQAIERLGVAPGNITFVDDRPRNLEAARKIGIRTVLFDVNDRSTPTPHRHARRLADLL